MKIEASQRCSTCTKEVCCCTTIHKSESVSMVKLAMNDDDDCCASGVCNNDIVNQKTVPKSRLLEFFKRAKALYAAALGIEILCIAAAEIGENTGLYLFGFNLVGIPIAYATGYALAGLTTFATILGRYNYGSNDRIDSCCFVLEQGGGDWVHPQSQDYFQKLCSRHCKDAAVAQAAKLEVHTKNESVHLGYCRECMYLDGGNS